MYCFRCYSNIETHCEHDASGMVDVWVQSSLVKGFSPVLPLQTQVDPIQIADSAVSELSSGIMALCSGTAHNIYTTICMIKMLCARLAESITCEAVTRPRSFEDWQLSELAKALKDATEESVTVAQIADRCRLSVCQFSRLFKATHGVPLHRYLVNQRIKQAKAMLSSTKEPISQIAIGCGFADQSSFTRRFTAVTGLPPALWRKQIKEAGFGVTSSTIGILQAC
jgi:transcriptional regulator GlxA family with amidase domain